MPSSTSSSDPEARAPDVGWSRTLLAALLVTLAALAALEALGRAGGLEPSVSDSPRMWAHWRDRVQPDSVVLLGSSRVQTGVRPDILAERLGRPVVMLALNGGSPLPMLTDLADDPSFRGMVVCGVPPAAVFGERAGWDQRARDYVEFARTRSWVEQLETPMRIVVQRVSVLTLPQMAPARLLRTLASGSLPRPSHVTMGPSRYESIDFELYPDEVTRDGVGDMTEPFTGDRLTRRLEAIRSDVEAIEERGGDVVFVRMPASQEVVDNEDREYPPATHLRRLAKLTGAPVIDASVEPTMRDFDCPDSVHLAAADAEAFTGVLANLLRDQDDGQ